MVGLMRTAKKEWIPKGNNVGLMGQTSQKPSSNEVWYFDSGCSRHMTGKIGYIENIRPCEKGMSLLVMVVREKSVALET